MAVCQALSLAGWLNSDVLRGVHCSASALRLSASGTYYRSRVFRSEWRLKAVVRRKNGYLRVRLTEAAVDRRPAAVAHSPAAPPSRPLQPSPFPSPSRCIWRPRVIRAELAVADSRPVAGHRAGSVNTGQNRLGTSQLPRLATVTSWAAVTSGHSHRVCECPLVTEYANVRWLGRPGPCRGNCDAELRKDLPLHYSTLLLFIKKKIHHFWCILFPFSTDDESSKIAVASRRI